jgi:rhomboid protease GluP
MKFRVRHRRVTLFFTAIIGAVFVREVQLAIACCRYTLADIWLSPSEPVLRACGAAYTGMSLQHEWWRLITSIFVHGGAIHLAANVIALLQLGYLLEALFGGPAIALSFSIGGIAAGLAVIVFPDSAGMVYVGASGAIFAIAGTLLVGLRRLTKASGSTWSHRVSSRLAGCLAFNFGLGLVVSAIAAWFDLGFAIANTAHVAGLITGIVVGLLLPLELRKNELTRRMTGIG